MDYREKLNELIKKQNGTVMSSDLNKYEIPRTYLSMMVKEGSLERIDRGIYVHSDSIEDEIYAFQVKYPKLIYPHETVLFLYDLSDRTPFNYSATVTSGYKIKKELYEIGITEIDTTFGNKVKVYNVERTICDIIRSKNRMDIQIFSDGLKRAFKLKKNNHNLLLEYARAINVEKQLIDYLEVLY